MSESSAGRVPPGPPGDATGAEIPARPSAEHDHERDEPRENEAPQEPLAPEGTGSGAVAPAPPVGTARRPRIGDTRPGAPAPRRPRPGPEGTPAGGETGAPSSGAPAGTGSLGRAPVNGPTSPAEASAADAPQATPESDAMTVGRVAEAAASPAGNGAGPEGDRPGRRSGRSRRRSRSRTRPAGRYLVCVHVAGQVTHIAMLEGRSLVEHYVSRPSDDVMQIDGNVYRGRVQNVLPGMEAAFIDIGIPKNAVLYRGDVRYDRDDVEQGSRGPQPRIEDVLAPGQTILCQVTKNPIGAKGARLTQEVSLPGRFAVLVPNSSTFGISKRLGDNERRRLRRIVDEVRPSGHGLIVRTAAEGASADELRRDVNSLLEQWRLIDASAGRSDAPGLLYREPDLAVRLLREELTSEYRGVVIDDVDLYEEVRTYVGSVSPDLVERVELHDLETEALPIFERYHVHEQLHKALDRKVWLPSGGSLIIERTEALTVIDVNTGKNVGSKNLEETVFRNNLEAAEEVARQLRLRDIGGIIVIDFIDMEIAENRAKVAAALRAALARDKTRTQVFDISELGLVEMTRKRVSEGLIESLSSVCEYCQGRGIVLDRSVL